MGGLALSSRNRGGMVESGLEGGGGEREKGKEAAVRMYNKQTND